MNKFIFGKIQKHCTEDLWNLVLDYIENNDSNEWDVSELLNSKIPQFEALKVICCFEKMGGLIFYKGEFMPYVFLIKFLEHPEYDDIRLFWLHTSINGMMPIYGLGSIDIPQILPKFAVEEGVNKWYINKLIKGAYVRLKGEEYSIKMIAEERAQKLNLTCD